MTGEESYAGITGYSGKWTATAGGQSVTTTFCISPTFPLALCTKMQAAGGVFEYTLVEATGF